MEIKCTFWITLHLKYNSMELEVFWRELNIKQGIVTIDTDYIAPNAPYLHFIDYYNLLTRKNPVWILGDFNVRHPTISNTGNRTTNKVGTHIDGTRQTKTHFPTLPNLHEHPILMLFWTTTEFSTTYISHQDHSHLPTTFPSSQNSQHTQYKFLFAPVYNSTRPTGKNIDKNFQT